MYKYGNLAYVTLILVSFISFTNIFLANKYYALAEGNSSKLQWQQAISDYDKSIKFMPLRADGHAAKGSVYALRATLALGAQKEEFRKNAILNFLKAVKLNSSQSIYYLNLAWLYVDERRDADAIYAFKKAIDKKPTEGLFYFPYADYCLEHGLFDEALANYRKGLSLFVDENWLRTFYGSEYDGVFEKIYNTTKDYNLLKKVVPDNLSICFNFARFLEKKQMLDEAYLEYKTILTKYPENTAVQQAIKGLKKE
jgi:tetratricopeptide (TPR) repeat protein